MVAALAPRAQALFFTCTAEALLADAASGVQEALGAGREYALTGRVPEAIPELLAVLDQRQAERDETDVVLHDGLICADIALRIASQEFNAGDGIWYALEPQFQRTSERLFGFTDVGSEREQRDEATALEDPVLGRAVKAIEGVLAHLEDEPTWEQAHAVCHALRVLRP